MLITNRRMQLDILHGPNHSVLVIAEALSLVHNRQVFNNGLDDYLQKRCAVCYSKFLGMFQTVPIEIAMDYTTENWLREVTVGKQ